MRTKHLTTIWLFLSLVGASISTGAPPASQPPLGLTAKVLLVRTRDADTIEVRLQGSAYIFAIRLIDTWCPETDSKNPGLKAIALQGKKFTDARCKSNNYLTVFIPLKATDYPLKALTFDRIPAWVFIGEEETTLNEQLVTEGLASSQKGGKLGE
jgi:endonuclease YncB( thermonuclease family)